ncbi:HTH_Tnp_Tc3_2 domain-containing protein [Trichonephila clavipes]|nr:HTH_Tnp_Tc3_2 domain-containing protein [Trichonephila clavipes]
MPRARSRNAYQHVSDFDKGRIVAYRNCLCVRFIGSHSIAARFGRISMTVSRVWNQWVQDGKTECRAGSQRPFTTIPSIIMPRR